MHLVCNTCLRPKYGFNIVNTLRCCQTDLPRKSPTECPHWYTGDHSKLTAPENHCGLSALHLLVALFGTASPLPEWHRCICEDQGKHPLPREPSLTLSQPYSALTLVHLLVVFS